LNRCQIEKPLRMKYIPYGPLYYKVKASLRHNGLKIYSYVVAVKFFCVTFICEFIVANPFLYLCMD
jgi:hypothetical protein